MATKVPDAGDSAICLTWGHYFVGRERAGMDCFKKAIEYCERHEGGKIKKWMIGVASQGNFTSFAGYLVMQGNSDDIDWILKDDSMSDPNSNPATPPGFLELVSLARHCVFNFSVVRCDAGVAIDPKEHPDEDQRSPRRKKFDKTGKKLSYSS